MVKEWEVLTQKGVYLWETTA